MLQIFTVRNEGNVFTPVCHSVHGGCLADTPWADTALADTPWADNRPPPRQTPHPPADGYCSGRYAYYWNAFLLSMWSLNLRQTQNGNRERFFQ